MDIKNAARGFVASIASSSFSRVFSHPVYVSLLITACITFIVLCMYDSDRLIKTTIYMFFATLAIVFIHNKLLLIGYRNRADLAAERAVVTGMGEVGPLARQGGAARSGGGEGGFDVSPLVVAIDVGEAAASGAQGPGGGGAQGAPMSHTHR